MTLRNNFRRTDMHEVRATEKYMIAIIGAPYNKQIFN